MTNLPETADAERAIPPYTPAGLVAAYNLAVRVPLETAPITIRGIYAPAGGKNYNGYYYDRLREEFGPATVDVRVPEALRVELRPEHAVTLRGHVERRVNAEGTIKVYVTVTSILGQEARLDPGVERKQALMRRIQERAPVHPEQVLKAILARGEKPRLALVYGETAITDQDVMRALGTAEAEYQITPVRVPFLSPAAVSAALEDCDLNSYDLIAVVRGGGAGLEAFDDLRLAEAAADLETPLLTAIGHEADHPFLEQMAAKAFSTPTALGTWLRTVVEAFREEQAHSKAALIKDVEGQFAPTIRALEQQVAEGRRNAEQWERLHHEDQKRIEALSGAVGRGQLLVIVIAVGACALAIGFALGALWR